MFDNENGPLIAPVEKLPFTRKDASFKHHLHIWTRLTDCSLFANKVEEENAITCVLYPLLHTKPLLGGIHDL